MGDPNRGREIVVANIALSLMATLAMSAVHLSREGWGMRHPVRFAVTAALFWWMYRGSVLARWVVVVLFGLAGLVGLVNLLSGSLSATVVAAGSIAYLVLASVVATSADVKEFLRGQQRQVPSA